MIVIDQIWNELFTLAADVQHKLAGSHVETEAGLVQVGLGEVVVLHVLAEDLLN